MIKYAPSVITLVLILWAGCSSQKNLSPNVKKANIYYDQGTLDLVRGNYTKALDHFLNAVKLNPKDARIHNNLGMSYYFKGQNEKAVIHFKKAIELDPKNSDAQNNLGGVYFKLKRFDLARHYYLKVQKNLVYGHQYRTYYNLALIDIRQGDINSAVNNLRKSIGDKRDYCPALYRLGIIEKERRNYLKALNYFKEGIKGVCYEKPESHFQLALMWQQLGQDTKAARKFKEIKSRFHETGYGLLAEKQLRELQNVDNKALKTKGRQSKMTIDNLEEKIPEPLAY